MKRAWILFATVAALLASSPVKRASVIAVEKSIDQRMKQLTADDRPLAFARGVYLDGYGAVFTTEVNLAVSAGPSPFQPVVPKEAVAKIRKTKLERLPALRQSMKEMLMSAAASLDEVPAKEQIAIGVSLVYFSYEDASGMPGQILMQGERGKLIDAKLGRVSIDSVVKAQEF